MLNVRLSKELEEALNYYSATKRISKSSIVKKALQLYLKKEKQMQTPYELGADLFGKEGSGKHDASVAYKKRIRQKLNEKHSG